MYPALKLQEIISGVEITGIEISERVIRLYKALKYSAMKSVLL
jgi:hypothetical protein